MAREFIDYRLNFGSSSRSATGIPDPCTFTTSETSNARNYLFQTRSYVGFPFSEHHHAYYQGTVELESGPEPNTNPNVTWLVNGLLSGTHCPAYYALSQNHHTVELFRYSSAA